MLDDIFLEDGQLEKLCTEFEYSYFPFICTSIICTQLVFTGTCYGYFCSFFTSDGELHPFTFIDQKPVYLKDKKQVDKLFNSIKTWSKIRLN